MKCSYLYFVSSFQALEDTIMIINGVDVTQLDDDDLFSRLQDLGATVGPIVGM